MADALPSSAIAADQFDDLAMPRFDEQIGESRRGKLMESCVKKFVRSPRGYHHTNEPQFSTLQVSLVFKSREGACPESSGRG